jgi:hypothetical protein
VYATDARLAGIMRNYKYRYSVEHGNWPKPTGFKNVAPGVGQTENDYGLTEDLFIVLRLRP